MARPQRRRPRNKAELLPLPVATVRKLSLRHHSALAALQHGYGNAEHLSVLLFAVYVTYLMECEHTGAKPEPAPFRAAEVALQQCVFRARGGAGWNLNGSEAESLAGLLALHDTQLNRYRSACYANAWVQMNEAASVRLSPLADGHVLPSRSSAFFWVELAPDDLRNALRQAACADSSGTATIPGLATCAEARR
jgi:hypothetical protein